jgi:hypothetical protein
VTSKTAIARLLFVAVVGAVVAGIVLWPRTYRVGETAGPVVVFWHADEAFVFLSKNAIGRAASPVQERLDRVGLGFLSLMFTDVGFYEPRGAAFRIASDGGIERFSLPKGSVSYGTWTLHEGRLQLTAPPSSYTGASGFRWDGTGFVAVPSEPEPPSVATTEDELSDDLDREDDGRPVGSNAAQRRAFKDAGWHYKILTGYVADRTETSLPIALGNETLRLTVRSFPRPKDDDDVFDLLALGIASVEVAGRGRSAEVLWSQEGWKEIPKSEYDRKVQEQSHGRSTGMPVRAWIVLALGLVVFIGKPLLLLYGLFTAKHRVVKGMATSYAFPPATPAQFPNLDRPALDRYTTELEAQGFARILDFSIVADSPNHPASFCRLLAHQRHLCFAEVTQFFPNGQAPMPLKWGVTSTLGDGWTLTFSDRKPLAFASLTRRARALGVSMPLAGTAELLGAFLKMRSQICLDLQLTPSSDLSLDAFTAQVQTSLAEIREVVQSRSFTKGLSEVAIRKLSLLRLRPEYSWLGDYPKEAERRRLGAAIEPR